MRCPNCSFESPPEMRFCGRCGTSLKRSCPACNFANLANYRFCGMCGTSLPLEPGVGPPPQSLPAAATLVEHVLADELPKLNFVQPAPAPPPPLVGERRVATVLMADVFGSTDLLEQIGTETWVGLMNRVLQILEAEIYRFGGRVGQFLGDGLLAFFGAPSAHEDDPERAVLAALAMQEAIQAYLANLANNERIHLRLRIGVNTGEVIVTSIGDSRQYSEDMTMGEAVNLAARLEQAAEPGTVLVSEHTYRQVSSHFTWESLGQLTLKGLSQPVAVYRPLAPLATAAQSPSLRNYGLSAPLIGRADEFQILESRVQDLGSGRGGIVMVAGDEGLGKSYLVNEVRHHAFRDLALRSEAQSQPADRENELSTLHSPLPTLHSLVWLQGRCRSYDQSSPYSMWFGLLRNWLGVPEGEPETATRERLYRQAEALWGDRLPAYYPYLAAFLSLPLEELYAERVKHLDADGLRQQFYWTIKSWIEAMSRRGPLVLVFSDVHWSDASSLNLLEYCLPLCDYESVLWLLVFRPQRTSAVWKFRYRVETEFPHRLDVLTLSPLTDAESGEMIDRLIGPNALPAETRTLILTQAEGNPYYIEELIYVLIEQGVLVQDEQTGQWRATRAVTSLDLPGTLHSLLLARIDSLSAEERRLLQMAAVIGPTFWSNVLQALFGDGARLRQHLTAMQRAQFIYERGQMPELGMEYSFKSKLIRDVAYLSILSQQRAGYHRQVADYLEQQFGNEVPLHHYGMLAYHYRQAGVPGKELFYTRLAAEQATRIYANAEALELCNRALELLDEMEAETADADRRYTILTNRFEVLNERRELFYRIGDYEAGLADAQAMLPLAQQLGDDPAWLIDALLQQPGVAHWASREELSAGLALASQALALAQRLGDRYREMRCLLTLSMQRLTLNDPTWHEAGEQALALARHLHDLSYQVRILTQMGSGYSWSDQPERGMTYLEEALPICRALDDRITEVHLLNRLGLEAERQGDYYRSLAEYQRQALHISREVGYRWGESEALIKCGQTQATFLGDYEGGLALLEQGRLMGEGLPYEIHILLRLIQIRAMQGEYEVALAALERARSMPAPDVGDTMIQAGLHLVAAILYNALGTENDFRQVLELAAQTSRLLAENPVLTRQYEIAAACQAAVAHLGLAGCVTGEAERQTHRQQALYMSQAALDGFQSLGFIQIIECVSEEIFFRHSQALAANGRDEEAAEFRQRAGDEMMRKHDLIPADTPFRHTFLENIPLHRDIRSAGLPPTQ